MYLGVLCVMQPLCPLINLYLSKSFSVTVLHVYIGLDIGTDALTWCVCAFMSHQHLSSYRDGISTFKINSLFTLKCVYMYNRI